MFTPIWWRFPVWLIFFRWVGSTTNHKKNELSRVNSAGKDISINFPPIPTPGFERNISGIPISYLKCNSPQLVYSTIGAEIPSCKWDIFQSSKPYVHHHPSCTCFQGETLRVKSHLDDESAAPQHLRNSSSIATLRRLSFSESQADRGLNSQQQGTPRCLLLDVPES